MLAGGLLGALAGGIIGAVRGGADQAWVVAPFGFFYGYVAGWSCCGLWYWLAGGARAWFLGACTWLLAPILTARTWIAVVHIDDPGELRFDDWLVFGTSLVMVILTGVVESVRNQPTTGNRGIASSETQAGTIDLLDDVKLGVLSPVGKLWLMASLLALKDEASEVVLEEKKGNCTLHYRLDGELIELVPPPSHTGSELVPWLECTANLRAEGSPLAVIR